MQYVLIAHDGNDTGAQARRMEARPAHLENARRMKEQKRLILGGAILNDEGKMAGSVMVVDFDTEDELKQWLRTDPYVTGKVWEKMEVKPFRCATIPG